MGKVNGKNHHSDYSHCEGLSETASKLQRKGPINPFLKITTTIMMLTG